MNKLLLLLSGVFGGIASLAAVVPSAIINDCIKHGCKPQFGAGPYPPGNDNCYEDSLGFVIVLARSDGLCECLYEDPIKGGGGGDGAVDFPCVEKRSDCILTVSISHIRGGTPESHPESYCITTESGTVCQDFGFWLGETQEADPLIASVAGCDDFATSSYQANSGFCVGSPPRCPPVQGSCWTILQARCRECKIYSCVEYHEDPNPI